MTISCGKLLAVALTGVPAICFAAGAANPLDDLVPRPVRIERRAGERASAGIRFVRGEVPGAPAAVREEAYVLDVAADGITVTACDPRGERYARVTLDQLTKLSGGRIPCCRIVDWPVLRWRGYMNDCGRNYLAVPGVKAILDVMAAYKLNLFHWHLTDYHGWRLESKRHPELQSAKAFYGRQPGKCYTQDEFREIVAYAAARGITVMPELDVPGHTLALRRGLGVATMSDPGVKEKVTELFEELCSLADAETMPFVHLGTDEARTREEKCDDAYVTEWVKAVNACGRKAVVWAPGKKVAAGCDVVDMAWYDNHVTNSVNPFFYADHQRGYNGGWSPFDVLSHAVFADPRHWILERGRQLGAIGCTWHDDNVGEDTYQLFRECAVFPSLLGFADTYWSGREADRPEYLERLPSPDSPLFAQAREFERRILRQRDTFFGGFRFPFPFVKQTDMRWRVTDSTTGRVVARDVPQGTVWIRNRRVESASFIKGKGGAAVLETWIRSPDDRTVGAWIDCAGYFGCYTRLGGRTPRAGEWNSAGAKVFVNGVEIAPPEWKQPGMRSTTPAEREQDIPYSTDLLEKPLVDELPMLRPPSEITLKKGWNSVRIELPETENWGATFALLSGTSEHPREVDGLAYRSETWLDNRISRNWRAPINRPPLNRDELLDGNDYYDEDYLSSMAADGVNGLWIPVRLEELSSSPSRKAKLASIVRKARSHGIGIWLMMNEPECVAPDDRRVSEHPEWFAPGPVWWDRLLWCPSSKAALSRVRELTANVFRSVPDLSGIINISHGEGLTTCLSLLAPCDVSYPDGIRCSACAARPPWQLHADLATAMVEGMREGNPSARLLSWLYQPEAHEARRDWVNDCAAHLPDGVTLVYNFESGSVREQKGRRHVGGDYWLSVPGPARPFSEIAAVVRGKGGCPAAKIQVGCSHEMATLPYVPVPGLLYRKFRGLREAGVRDVVQGWFFGNAPGVMNKAAGRLASVDFESVGEADFLSGLATDVWGASNADRVVKIWNAYAEAYSRYPLDNAMQYYGPFAAGIVWPLEREVRLAPLARTWMGGEPPSGDFIGECLGSFSLDEVCELTEEMANLVCSVDGDLQALARSVSDDAARTLDVGVMRAFRNLIVSAADVFAFYRARRDGRTDEMDRIAAKEMELSQEMLALAEADERLGWHPEAGERLFSPDKLRLRIKKLAADMGRRPEPCLSSAAAHYGETVRGSNIVWRAEMQGGDCVIRGTVTNVPGLVIAATDRFGTVRPKVEFVRAGGGPFEAVLRGFRPDRIAFMADENPSAGSASVLWPTGRDPVDGRLALQWVDGASFGDLVSRGARTEPERPYSFRRRLECVHRSARCDFFASSGTNEYVVTDGIGISVPAGTSEFLRRVAGDFADYLAVSMSVESRVTASPDADVKFVVDGALPAGQYRISTRPNGIGICGADERAVAQAFYRLEDRMNLRRAPFLVLGEERRTPVFKERLTHPGYGYAMYPDEHLAAMAHAGMTAIIIYINSVDGNGLNNHRADVGAIIRRAARYGLDTYLYSEIPMFAHPDDGDGPFEESYGRIAARYPDAKGIIIVGESCAFPSKDPRVQPRKGEWGPKEGDDRPLAGWFPCRDYPDWLRAVERAIKAHAPNMRTVFWTYNWGWAPEKDRLALIDALPDDTILQATFDMFEILPRRNGITTPIADYSLSFAGPSAYFASEAAAAKRRGLTLFTQANAGGRTWDFGTAPYEPFPFQWRKRWSALVRAHDDWGLSGVMENHHYGWSPTFIAELEKESFTEGGLPFDDHLRLIAARDFGERNADKALAAWRRWSAVIGDYVPTDINQYGPFRCGPAYPYTAGRPPADRKTFPVEPLSEVGSAFIRLDYLQSGFVIGNTDEDASVPYMEKEIELLGSMSEELEAGAQVFAGMPTPEARRMARLGAYLAACCRTARNVKRGAVAEIGKDAEGILAAARDEYANARAALELVESDSHLGWEPMMDYVGGPRQIRWKLELMERIYGRERLVSCAPDGDTKE